MRQSAGACFMDRRHRTIMIRTVAVAEIRSCVSTHIFIIHGSYHDRLLEPPRFPLCDVRCLFCSGHAPEEASAPRQWGCSAGRGGAAGGSIGALRWYI
jgi:hypothetical protein